jgi:hypothetical protein
MSRVARLAVVCAMFLCVFVLIPSANAQGSAPAVQPVSTPTGAPSSTLPAAKEEVLFEKDADAPLKDDYDYLSEDGKHLAWRSKKGNKWVAVLDGKPDKLEFDDIRWVILNKDGTHFSYRGKTGGSWVVVTDGKQGAPYDDVRGGYFSGDGKHFGYGAKKDKKWRMVVDATEQPATFDDMGNIHFSKDGEHTVFPAKRNKKWVAVKDGKEEPAEYDDIHLWSFAPDGRLVYVAEKKGDYAVVLDGREGPFHDVIGGLQFTEDGKRYVYGAVHATGRWKSDRGVGSVIVDGQEGPTFEGALTSSTKRDFLTGSHTILVRGYRTALWPNYHGVSSPDLSADGKHVAYAARRDKDDMTVVADGEAGPTFSFIYGGAYYSPNGKHLAYVARKLDGGVCLVVDGKCLGASIPAEGMDTVSSIVINDDGTHGSFVGVWGGYWYDQGGTKRARRRAIVDGIPAKEYDCIRISDVTITRDGKHHGYAVHDWNGSSLVVVDGVEGKRYDEVIYGQLEAKDDNTLTYIARTGKKYVRVAQAVK